MKRHESPWHKLTVETIRVLGEGDARDELDFHAEHPTECDQLKYGETCWFDGEFFEYDEEPTEPGIYRARVWVEGPDYAGEWDGGSEWEPLVPSKLVKLAEQPGPGDTLVVSAQSPVETLTDGQVAQP